MSRYDSNFREPPWVMGSPKEVMDWMDATHPKKDNKKETFEKKYLKNLQVKFDFDVPYKIIESKSLIDKITGKKNIEENFDIKLSTELILRGLSKAKFHNIAKIIVDKKILYDHPEKKSDLKKTIKILDDFSNQFINAKTVEINSVLYDPIKCIAVIKIKKIHHVDEHSVDIQIKGKIRKENYYTFLNYLKEKIGFKKDSK